MKSLSDFVNQTPARFHGEENAANAKAMREAIAAARAQFGHEYDLVIGGRRFRTAEKIHSLNPAHPSEVAGVHQKAGREHVEPAVQAALAAFESWKHVAAQDRAALIFRVAEILRRRKFEFNAWLVLEAGKNWDEAEADTCEAIDFCELYARTALHLAEAKPVVQLPGERDELRYIPLGVGAVIAPWNFPLAILCGMTVASVVSGNTVVLKPSSDSPTIAAKFFEALEEAGLPAGRRQFLPRLRRHLRATEWSSTPRPASSPSPDRATWAWTFTCAPRSRSPASYGSSAPFSKWAARTPSSLTPMPIWTPRWKAWPSPRSDSRGRSVRPVRGLSSTPACTPEFLEKLRERVARIPVAIRRKTSTWDR